MTITMNSKLNSILLELLFDLHETWVLPQSKRLSMVRHKGMDQEEARKEPQDSSKEWRQEEEQELCRICTTSLSSINTSGKTFWKQWGVQS